MIMPYRTLTDGDNKLAIALMFCDSSMMVFFILQGRTGY